jgi:hypothetical protein
MINRNVLGAKDVLSIVTEQWGFDNVRASGIADITLESRSRDWVLVPMQRIHITACIQAKMRKQLDKKCCPRPAGSSDHDMTPW